MAQVVKIALDASDLTSNAKAMLQSLSQQQQGVLNLARVMEKFNATGQPVRQVLQGLAVDGSAFEITLKKVGSAWEFVTGKTKAASNALQSVAQQQAAANAALNLQAAQQAGTVIRANAPNLANLSPTSINAVEAAIRKVQSAIESGRVSFQRFKEIYDALAADPKANLGNLTSGESKVAAGLREIQAEAKSATASVKGLGTQGFISLDGVARILESQAIKAGFRFIRTEIEASITEAADFSKEMARIQAISGSNATETARWQAQVTQLAETYGVTQSEIAKGAFEAYQVGAKDAGTATILLDNALKLELTTTLNTKQGVQLLAEVTEAYGLSAGQAGQATEIINETLNNSKTSAQSFSTEFGRLSVSAASVGVSLKEVSAALQAAQAKGLSFSDSAGLINSILLQLSNPSKELRQEFQNLGIATGQELLQLKGGFGGVLEFFEQMSKSGNKNLGQLAEGFESLHRRVNVGEDIFSDYQKKLAEVGESTNTVNNQVNTVADSLGVRLQKELAKVKEFWVNEFGTNILRVTLGINDNVVSLSSALKLIVPIGVDILGVIGAIRGVSYLAPGIIQLQTAIQGVTLSETEATLAANNLKSALSGVIAVAGAFTLGAVLEQTYIEPIVPPTVKEAPEKALAELQKFRQEFAKLNQAAIEQEAKAEDGAVTAVKEAYSKRISAIIEYEGKVVKSADDIRDREIKNLTDINDAVKANGKELEDSISKNIDDLSKQAREAHDDIEKSGKAIDDLQKHLSDTFSQNKLKYAEQGQALGSNGLIVNDQRDTLIRSRIDSLSKEAKKYAGDGTKEGIEQARKLYDEVEHLQAEVFDNETNLRKKAFEEEVKQGKATPTFDSATGKTRYVFTVQTAEFEKKINDLAKERVKIEDEFQAKESARQKAKEAEAEKEKGRLKLVQEALSQAAKFSVYDTKGSVKAEYVKDPNKAASDYQTILNRLTAVTTPVEQANFNLFSELYKKRIEVVKEVQAQITAAEAEEGQKRLSKTLNQRLEDAAAQRKQIEDQRKTISDAVERLTVASAVVSAGVVRPRTDIIGLPLRGQAPPELGAAEKAQSAFQEQLKKLDEVRQKGSPDEIKTAADDLEQKAKAYTDAAAAYAQVEGKASTSQLTIPGDKATIETRLTNIRGAAEAIQAAADTAVSARQKIDEIGDGTKHLDDIIQGLPKDLSNIGEQSKSMADIVDQSFSRLGNSPSLDTLIRKMEQVQSLMKIQSSGLPNPREGLTPIAGNMFGKVKYMQEGFIPRGSDSIPAMLSRGESVVNSEGTKEWGPFLQAINSGFLSKKSDGASHVTNIGDLSISVSGGDTSDQTIKEIGVGLRRALRRGLVTLE